MTCFQFPIFILRKVQTTTIWANNYINVPFSKLSHACLAQNVNKKIRLQEKSVSIVRVSAGIS